MAGHKGLDKERQVRRKGRPQARAGAPLRRNLEPVRRLSSDAGTRARVRQERGRDSPDLAKGRGPGPWGTIGALRLFPRAPVPAAPYAAGLAIKGIIAPGPPREGETGRRPPRSWTWGNRPTRRARAGPLPSGPAPRSCSGSPTGTWPTR